MPTVMITPAQPVTLGQRTDQSAAYRNYDIAPDGRQFVVIGLAGESPITRGATQLNLIVNWSEELKQRVPTR